MTRTQIQLPDPLYRRLKEVASANDWSLAEVIRRATALYLQRFSTRQGEEEWTFPTIDAGGEFLIDPAETTTEADTILLRNSQ